MRKRAGLARALVLNPEIVLFDEPDSGPDPVAARARSACPRRRTRLQKQVLTDTLGAQTNFVDALKELVGQLHLISNGVRVDLALNDCSHPAMSRNTIPVATQVLLTNLDLLSTSINTDDLTTTLMKPQKR